MIVVWLLFAALISAFGCSPNEPPPKTSSAPSPAEPPAQLPAAETPREVKEAPELPQPQPGTGKTVWAREFEGELVQGLDGAVYEPYHAGAIERTQRALTERGLYRGPVNGILDAPTAQAIYDFQKANYNLQICGVPTPRTRILLEQGSHTDARYLSDAVRGIGRSRKAGRA